MVELKSVEKVDPSHQKQGFTYVRLTGMNLLSLRDFGETRIKDGITRIVRGE
jgi:GxxExxY protein